jgi:hypothetical protein
MRPIDADRLMQELAQLKTDGGILTEEEYYAEDVEELIRKAPTVRMRPNVRTGALGALGLPGWHRDSVPGVHELPGDHRGGGSGLL